jgi:cyclophilin family peptidyl-prolyl cis-trans isomerase
MKNRIFYHALIAVFLLHSCTAKKTLGSKVTMLTNKGKIVVKLYSETPKHKENFVKLVNEGFYNGVLFHRVIHDFMIQAGDPKSKSAKPEDLLGAGDVGYTIPSEFNSTKFYHKKGALSAARKGDEVNPNKESSGCQFYIVEGRKYSDVELDNIDKVRQHKLENKLLQDALFPKKDLIAKLMKLRNQAALDKLRDSALISIRQKMQTNTEYKLTQQQREDYKKLGGTPYLDGEYTVFGEVEEGIDVVESISKTATSSNDRPVEDVKIIRAFSHN